MSLPRLEKFSVHRISNGFVNKDYPKTFKQCTDNYAVQTGFSPVADDKTAPSAAVDRLNAGDFAKVPMLVGNVENEAGFIWPVLLAYTFFDKSTVNTIAPLTQVVQPILDIANLVGFTCGARQAAGLRVDQGVTTYRYRFYGQYHSSPATVPWSLFSGMFQNVSISLGPVAGG